MYVHVQYAGTYVRTYIHGGKLTVCTVCAPDVHIVTAYALDDSTSLSLALAEHHDQS